MLAEREKPTFRFEVMDDVCPLRVFLLNACICKLDVHFTQTVGAQCGSLNFAASEILSANSGEDEASCWRLFCFVVFAHFGSEGAVFRADFSLSAYSRPR